MRYTIQCCGPSKDFFSTTEIAVESSDQLNPDQLKKRILTHLKPGSNYNDAQSMLAISLIASSEKILDVLEPITQQEKLFLLPPVCGG